MHDRNSINFRGLASACSTLIAAVLLGLFAGQLYSESQGQQSSASSSSSSGQSQPAGSGQQSAPFHPEKSLVSLYVTRRMQSSTLPWEVPDISSITASGVLLKNNLVLTDIENVRNQVSIDLYNYLTGSVHRARVKYLCYDCGLALLEVEQKDVFASNEGAVFTNDPMRINEVVHVVGSAGGKIVTRGRVAAATDRELIHSPAYIHTTGLRLLDNSDVDYLPLTTLRTASGEFPPELNGGVVYHGEQPIGIFHRSTGPSSESYMIGIDQIQRLLKDIEDNHYDGMPDPGFIYSPLLNEDLIDYKRLPGGERGVIINRVSRQSGIHEILNPGDVLLGINGVSIDGDGYIRKDNSVVWLDTYLRSLPAGKIKLRISRNGNIVERDATLGIDPANQWRRAPLEGYRSYFLGAGLVFQELDYSIIHLAINNNNRSLHYLYDYFVEDNLDEFTDRVVVLTGILDDPGNRSFDTFLYRAIHSINGKRIRNLADFAQEWNNTQTRFLTIEFEESPVKIILDTQSNSDIDRRVEKKFRPQENGRVR